MGRYIISLGIGLLSLTGILIGTVAIVLLTLPDVSRLKGCMTTEMYKVQLCPTGNSYTPLRQISPHMIAATIISEDSAFYQHKGFDFNEIKASIDQNLESGGYARGASTISQQLVKNVFLSPDKSILRKLKEAFLTYELEKIFKKNEILERYLNVVEFGKDIFGVKSAARHYFSKSPAQLNVLESAFLVSLLPNPKKYSASFRSKKLTPYMRGRVLKIAGKLAATGRISPGEYQFARANVDAFPWSGLENSISTTEDILSSIESTDFSKEPTDGEVLPEVQEPESEELFAAPVTEPPPESSSDLGADEQL